MEIFGDFYSVPSSPFTYSLLEETYSTLTKISRQKHSQSAAISHTLRLRHSSPSSKVRKVPRSADWVIQSVIEDKELASKKNSHSHEPKKLLFPNGSKTLKASSSEVGGGHGDDGDGHDDVEKLSSRAINASIVLGFDTFVVSKLLIIDHDYWHGWTLYEVLQYVPEHNWIAYEQALKAKPVIAKMAIRGIVYSIGN
ncbi:hypothetical protein ES332_A10G120200v1 [Gossypium tomentosum]|uniref:Uncharacterized protein n=1 Tax=Gossypium tomentosum TaxID=34277 RepID=A0A5D2NNY0_GOSTO|nr:hypothetical protein ES332_A10G120200v1 [Gossypium tomentosum]